MSRRRQAWRAWLLWGLLMSCLPCARAHDMPQSQVSVQVLEGLWQVQAHLPADRLAVAMAQAAGRPAGQHLPALDQAAVRAYLQGRVWAQTPTGPPWPSRLTALQPPTAARDEWVAVWQLPVPAATPAEAVRLHYEVITREVATHAAVLVLSQDWDRGELPSQPRWLGRVSHSPLYVDIQRASPAPWAAMRSLVRQGVEHMAHGADHLLFVFTLWLTAGLRVERGRWQPASTAGSVLRAMAGRVSAFTVGHSLALVAVVLRWLPPAGPIVEALIALSIAACAWHAWQPLFPRRELVVVAGFGCLHGMAFAEGLSGLQVPVADLLRACLAFNAGLELAQLGAVVLTAPLGLWLACSAGGPARRARRAAAALVGLCSAVWLVQRLVQAA